MSEVKVDKISPRSGTDVTLGDASDTFTLPASATIQVASSGEIDIASGATLDVNGTIDVTGATKTGFSANTPRFDAFLSVNQDPSDATWTKITFNGVNINYGLCYDSTNHRFVVPTDEGGTYFLYTNITLGSQGTTYNYASSIDFYKNGSALTNGAAAYFYAGAGYNYRIALSIQQTVVLSAADYIEVFGYIDESDGNPRFWADHCVFGGFKLL